VRLPDTRQEKTLRPGSRPLLDGRLVLISTKLRPGSASLLNTVQAVRIIIEEVEVMVVEVLLLEAGDTIIVIISVMIITIKIVVGVTMYQEGEEEVMLMKEMAVMTTSDRS
jgi:hypothetical protein